MGIADRSLRASALPFAGQIMGYNRNENSDSNISSAAALGDLNNLATAPTANNMIRILKPSYGTTVAAYLTMTLAFSSLEAVRAFRVSVSKITSDTDFSTVTPNSAQIDDSMRKLTGSTAPFTAPSGQAYTIDGLNLMPALPAPADADFRKDCFVLGVHFATAPLTGNGYALTRFRVDMSSAVLPA